MSDKCIYMPCTINELIAGLKNMISKSSSEITGEEYITGAKYVYSEDNEWELMPNSIVFSIVRGTFDPEKGETGVVIIPPVRSSTFM